jgi:hypothetical protein
MYIYVAWYGGAIILEEPASSVTRIDIFQLDEGDDRFLYNVCSCQTHTQLCWNVIKWQNIFCCKFFLPNTMLLWIASWVKCVPIYIFWYVNVLFVACRRSQATLLVVITKFQLRKSAFRAIASFICGLQHYNTGTGGCGCEYLCSFPLYPHISPIYKHPQCNLEITFSAVLLNIDVIFLCQLFFSLQLKGLK